MDELTVGMTRRLVAIWFQLSRSILVEVLKVSRSATMRWELMSLDTRHLGSGMEAFEMGG
jgi:hypothetical protein